MTSKLTFFTPVKAQPTRLSCDGALAESKAARRFASSMQYWPRAVGITVALLITTLCVGITSGQTSLSNGASQAGTLVVNTTNSYTFTANVGDNVVLQLGSTGFQGVAFLALSVNFLQLISGWTGEA
jgi:hypothetical protein